MDSQLVSLDNNTDVIVVDYIYHDWFSNLGFTSDFNYNDIMDVSNKRLSQILPEIYQDVASPGMRSLGIAIAGIVDFCTIPSFVVSELSKIAKENIRKNLLKYAKKLDGVPEKSIVPVHSQIAVPIIQKFSYITNKDIANLFANLLKTVSCRDTVGLAHPSFENIISQLSPDEAKILQYLRTIDYM